MSSDRAPSKPQRSDAAHNRVRILDTAAQVFAERGAGVDVREIARAAGVGMGTLYRHFPTKDQLVEAVLHDSREQWLAWAQRLLEDEEAGQALHLFMEGTLTEFAKHRGLLESFTRNFGALMVEDFSSPPVHALIDELIANAKAAGELREDVTVQDIGLLLIAVGRTIELTEKTSPGTWRRPLAVILDGLRPLRTS
jgi:AcrR family transcriptional regulator